MCVCSQNVCFLLIVVSRNTRTFFNVYWNRRRVVTFVLVIYSTIFFSWQNLLSSLERKRKWFVRNAPLNRKFVLLYCCYCCYCCCYYWLEQINCLSLMLCVGKKKFGNISIKKSEVYLIVVWKTEKQINTWEVNKAKGSLISDFS